MKRTLIPITAAATGIGLLAACSTNDPPESGVEPTDPAPVTISLWHGYGSTSDVEAFNEALRGFEDAHPWITVDSTEGMWDDEVLLQAAQAGNAPDVAMSFTTDNLVALCEDGVFEDLAPYLAASDIDVNALFPAKVRGATEIDGQRCAMPMLADSFGLYYNRDLMAGNPPPTTLTELAELTKELTVRDPDGTIEVAGFVPLMEMYQHDPVHTAPMVGAEWINPDGTSAVGSDPAWRQLWEWQKDLIDWFGYEELRAFRESLGEQWSPDNPFSTGKVAMALDGEWRTAMIAADAPDLDYGTAPLPVADDKPHLYGSGFVAVSILGISQDTPHKDAAWELVRYLSTDTDTLVTLANTVRNLPTTMPSLRSPDLTDDEHFATFLEIFDHPHSNPLPPHRNSYFNQGEVRDAQTAYEAGEVTDLPALLAEVDQRINDELTSTG